LRPSASVCILLTESQCLKRFQEFCSSKYTTKIFQSLAKRKGNSHFSKIGQHLAVHSALMYAQPVSEEVIFVLLLSYSISTPLSSLWLKQASVVTLLLFCAISKLNHNELWDCYLFLSCFCRNAGSFFI
jgi:hypothetical protein